MEAVCEHLSGSKGVKSVKLRGNRLGDDGVELLCDALRGLKVCNIDLSDNHVSEDGAYFLLDLCVGNKFVKSVKLKGNRIERKSAKVLEKEFKRSRVIAEF